MQNNTDSLNGGLCEVLEIINELSRKSVSGNYIYRGETQCYDKVSSSLYRESSPPALRDIEVLQQADLDEARRYTHETDEFAILTELQHYGGKTNLIDFTADYLIALFFACDGNHLQDGRVILLEKSDELNEYIYGPSNPVSRVLAQKSVFVRPPAGYVEPNDTVVIPHSLKVPMLDYLQKAHGISTETIYNDLHGFIRSRAIHREAFEHLNAAAVHRSNGNNQSVVESCGKALDLNPRMAMAHQARGVAYNREGDFDRAIADFDRVVELLPSYFFAYANRGIAYNRKGDFDRAIADFDRVIELNPNYTIAYTSRGSAYSCKGDLDWAIAEYNKAIELSPDYAPAYALRGVAYARKADFHRAIAEYDRAIELAPDDSNAYGNLGEAWLHLSDWGKARVNLIAARDMGMDIATSFHNDYESVENFEEKYGVEVPHDIAAMLAFPPPQTSSTTGPT